MLSLTKTSSRQREILEVLFRNGWDYIEGLMKGSKGGEPRLPTPAVLRNILVELGPVYVKLGQLLSTLRYLPGALKALPGRYLPDILPSAYIEALSSLQAKVPPVAWSQIEVMLRQELPGPLHETFSAINNQPVAVGSIGQVHRATLADGREVALKIQLQCLLSESGQSVNLDPLENDYDRMLRKYYNLSLSEIYFSEVFYEFLEISRKNKIKLPGNMGLYAKALANLEGVARSFNSEVNLLDEIKPLMTDLFRRQLLGDKPIETLPYCKRRWT